MPFKSGTAAVWQFSWFKVFKVFETINLLESVHTTKMILFKAIIVGILAWQLILQLRRRREQPTVEPTYVFIPPDGPQKDTALLSQRGPPPSYDAAPIKY